MQNDNIGGYRSIEIICLSSIQILETEKNTIRVVEKEGDWISIPFQKKSAQIIVTPKDENAGLIYENDIELTIPNHLTNKELDNYLSIIEIEGCILRYTTNNGETFIIGGKDYPLLLTKQIIHPGAVSKISGYKLQFHGKSTYPQRASVI